VQLGAAIGTVREHEQLVRAAVANEKIQLSITVDVSESNGACACAAPWEAGNGGREKVDREKVDSAAAADRLVSLFV